MTFRAKCFTPVSGHHYAVLHLILILLHHPEKSVDSLESFAAMPEQVFLRLRQLRIWFVDWETGRSGHMDESALPFAHFLPTPAGHGIVVDRKGRIGDDKTLVDAKTFTETLAPRTGTKRIVEIEQQIGGLHELQSVGLKAS